MCYYGAGLVFMDCSFACLVGKSLKLTQIIMLASVSPVAKIFYLCLYCRKKRLLYVAYWIKGPLLDQMKNDYKTIFDSLGLRICSEAQTLGFQQATASFS